MYRLVFSLLAVGMVAACGLVHGYWTDRWYPPDDVRQAAGRLEKLPLVLGDWDGHAVETKPGSVDPLLAGHMQRRYVNRVTGESVSIALVVGRPGPVSIHTPDVCYTASGYTVSNRSSAKVAGGDAEFLCMDAVRARAAEESRLRLYWAWNAGNGWVTSHDPRLAFAGNRVLFKLYVMRDLITLGEPSREDPCLTFMQTLLPALGESLFGPEA
jgi:hypothetical protein